MRATVIAFGRFTTSSGPVAGWRALGERLEDQLAHRLQRIEHAVTADGDGLEVRRPLHPFSAGNLLDEILAGMVRVGRDAPAGAIAHFPPRVELSLQIPDRRRVRQVALI